MIKKIIGLFKKELEIDVTASTAKALSISQSFEGNDPWANIAGNFDGAGLTCGALGWTMMWDNQQKLVRFFVDTYGELLARGLMPRTWDEYYSISKLPNYKDAVNLVSSWSTGANVKEPYYSELRAFWKSLPMRSIQISFAEKDMGVWAAEKSAELAKYLGLESIPLKFFCFYFDQAVMNGKGKNPAPMESEDITLDNVLDYIGRIELGSGLKDLKKNIEIFRSRSTVFNKVDSNHETAVLLKLAFLRASRSNMRYLPAILNRRLTIIMGAGFVNGQYRELEWVESRF